MSTENLPAIRACRPAWNKGRIVGQKRPHQPKHVWAIRVRLEIAQRTRELALFNLAIDSKLRGCDLVRLKVADVYAAGQVKHRAAIVQTKTQKAVSFEITKSTRRSIGSWLDAPVMVGSEYLWPGRFHARLHISTRQYARLVRVWVTSIDLEPSANGTHSMRRTKVAQIYRKTGNLRAVQVLLGHTKMDSTVRYIGVELEDALAIAEAGLAGPDRPRADLLAAPRLVPLRPTFAIQQHSNRERAPSRFRTFARRGAIRSSGRR